MFKFLILALLVSVEERSIEVSPVITAMLGQKLRLYRRSRIREVR